MPPALRHGWNFHMIQDIEPHVFDVGFRSAPPADGDYVVAARDGKILFAGDGNGGTFPRYADFRKLVPEAEGRLLYLFSIDGKAFFLEPAPAPDAESLVFRDMQSFRSHQPSWMAFAGVTAGHFAMWHERNRYCGRCAEPMKPKDDERAMVCSACGLTVYPAIAPAVIVGVIDGDRILMTRYAGRPYGGMALVAGFMEIGETVEDTVRREVLEEVGVRLKNIRYYKSQPWGFSGSVLMGFFADLDGSPEITIDTGELHEAAWIRREDIPPRDSEISLTSEMFEVFRRGHGLA